MSGSITLSASSDLVVLLLRTLEGSLSRGSTTESLCLAMVLEMISLEESPPEFMCYRPERTGLWTSPAKAANFSSTGVKVS